MLSAFVHVMLSCLCGSLISIDRWKLEVWTTQQTNPAFLRWQKRCRWKWRMYITLCKLSA